jgi:glycosyltransferase involved in cell wall biosynthesis
VGDGPLKSEINEQIKLLNIDDLVRVTGFLSINDVYNQFYKSHIFCATFKDCAKW